MCREEWRESLCGNCGEVTTHRCTLPADHGDDHVETVDGHIMAAWWRRPAVVT